MLHEVLIGLHATGGTVAFAAGCVAVTRRRALGIYLGGLLVLVACSAAAVGVDWSGIGVGLRATFTALTAFGGYVLWRGVRARRAAGEPGYLDHLGFTLIALFDGFAIVAVLVSGGPGWLAAVVGVVGVAVGHVAIERLKARPVPDRPGAQTPPLRR